jgi:hypothetical protein
MDKEPIALFPCHHGLQVVINEWEVILKKTIRSAIVSFLFGVSF